MLTEKLTISMRLLSMKNYRIMFMVKMRSKNQNYTYDQIYIKLSIALEICLLYLYLLKSYFNISTLSLRKDLMK